MKKKLIAHEAPLSIIEIVRGFTDYDYCLVHLLENQDYFQFFQDSLRIGRKVILDNSIFELGIAFDPDKFASCVVKLQPTEYIVPDVLEDCEGTINSLYHWFIKYPKLNAGLSIGVVQGKDYDELRYCYKKIEPHVNKVAISFNYSCYEDLFPNSNKYISWMLGRILVINRMLREKVINISKPHHLLGCSLPQEFMFYRDRQFDFIESIDTSNPVISGFMNQRYSSEGLWDKYPIKLADLIYDKVSESQLEDILFNISKFSSFVSV